MTRQGISRLVFALSLIFSSCLFLNGCGTLRIGAGGDEAYERGPSGKGPPPWAPAHGYRAKHKYRYYPSSQVYRDEERGVYIYYSKGKWRVSASLPVDVHVELGDYVTLEMDTDRPYEHHKDVVRHYPPGRAKKKKGKGHWK